MLDVCLPSSLTLAPSLGLLDQGCFGLLEPIRESLTLKSSSGHFKTNTGSLAEQTDVSLTNLFTY